jgi:hypothetical protein
MCDPLTPYSDDNNVSIYRLAFGTPAFHVDLVDPNIQLPTTLHPRAKPEPFFTFSDSNRGGSFAEVQILGTLTELHFISRNNDVTDISFLSATNG